jgi:hypothetical protein
MRRACQLPIPEHPSACALAVARPDAPPGFNAPETLTLAPAFEKGPSTVGILTVKPPFAVSFGPVLFE